ncbi:hypothetical protein YC2023_111914 [Brassica napus]
MIVSLCINDNAYKLDHNSLVEIGVYSAAIRLFNRWVVEKHPLDVVSYTVAVKGLERDKDRLKKIVWECVEEGVELDLNTKF